MAEKPIVFDHLLNSKIPLAPANAVAGILILEDGRYLMQLRDNIPEIFFPNHWSCFGGAIDAGESEKQAIKRELHEELGLVIGEEDARYFSQMSFDFGFAGHGSILRMFYEISVTSEQVDGLVVAEGQGMRAFDGSDLLSLSNVAPYDRFALWMHLSQSRLALTRATSPRLN